jgi:hypothetical protein
MITWEDVHRMDRDHVCQIRTIGNPNLACMRYRDHDGECHRVVLSNAVVGTFDQITAMLNDANNTVRAVRDVVNE